MVEVAKLYFCNTLDEKVYNASQDRWPKLHCPTSSHVKIPVSCWQLHCWCECLLWADLSSSFLAFCTLRIGPCRMAQTIKKRKTSCCTDLAMTMISRLAGEKVQLFKFRISEWKYARLSCSSVAEKNVKRFIQRDSTKKWITLQTEVALVTASLNSLAARWRKQRRTLNFGYCSAELQSSCTTCSRPEFLQGCYNSRSKKALVKLAWQTCKVQVSTM